MLAYFHAQRIKIDLLEAVFYFKPMMKLKDFKRHPHYEK
jgi:hypothetical protein